MNVGIRFEFKDSNIGIFKCHESLRIDCKYQSIYKELPVPPIDLFTENTRCYFTLQGYIKFKDILKEYYSENKHNLRIIRKHIKQHTIIYKDDYQYVINNY